MLVLVLIILQHFFIELQCLNESFIEKEKKALRYGFHQTHACQDFEKAFKCIRKCLDEKFDVAHSDKNCDCTCYIKNEKERFRDHALVGEGETPPTTKIPGWAQPSLPPNDESDEDDHTHADEITSDNAPQEGHVTAGGEAAHSDETKDALEEGEDAPAKGEEGEAPAEGEAEAEHDDAAAENGEAANHAEHAEEDAEAPAEGAGEGEE